MDFWMHTRNMDADLTLEKGELYDGVRVGPLVCPLYRSECSTRSFCLI